MKKWIIGIIASLFLICLGLVVFYFINLGPVSQDAKDITFTVDAGTTSRQVIDNLDAAGLIKNKYVGYIYLKLNKVVIKASTYKLNKAMNLKEIINKLAKGTNKGNTLRITFVEGMRLVEYVDLIAKTFNWSKDDLLKKLSDQTYLKELIAKYSFLTEDILNKDLYYPLEGYLYPDTYEFYKMATFEDVIAKLLKAMEEKVKIAAGDNQDYNFHDILTMASIVEKEAITSEDRAKVAQVINKRLSMHMNLGMDVTSYYGVKKDLKEELTTNDLDNQNPYNTRRSDLIGLPIGPICSPSLDSLKAVFNPADTDYIYFFADIKTGNVYFTNNYNEFLVFKERYS